MGEIMRVKILGCGPSYGVPSLSRGFGSCDPTNPKNFRLRSSVLIQEKDTNILIDFEYLSNDVFVFDEFHFLRSTNFKIQMMFFLQK